MMKKITILLVEDNRLLRDGISSILEKQSDMHVAASVGDGKDISEIISKQKPGIVLLDLGLGKHNSFSIVKLIREISPETKIIILDLIPLQADVFEFVQAGVSGFILKDANVAEFLETIRSVSAGEKVLPSNLAGSLFSRIVHQELAGPHPDKLVEAVRMTKRERQVIELIADCFTNKEIAQKLHLSPYTVKSHVHNILEKLSLHTRVQIAKHSHYSNSNKPVIDSSVTRDE
jgi:two-component system NarL family response regulator